MNQSKLDCRIRNRFDHKTKLVLAAVLMSTVLTGCGDDSDSPAPAAAAPTPTPTTATESAGLVATTTPASPASPGSPASPASTTLSWTPPTRNEDGSPLTLTGYKIYWGLTEGHYPHSVTIQNPGLSRYVIEQLAPSTWYFVATALSPDGESPPSNVVRMQVR